MKERIIPNCKHENLYKFSTHTKSARNLLRHHTFTLFQTIPPFSLTAWNLLLIYIYIYMIKTDHRNYTFTNYHDCYSQNSNYTDHVSIYLTNNYTLSSIQAAKLHTLPSSYNMQCSDSTQVGPMLVPWTYLGSSLVIVELAYHRKIT